MAFERRLEEIREAGEIGGDLGATVAANPHPLDTEESEAWLEGWRIGSRSQATDDDFDDPTGSGSALLEYLRSRGPSGRDAFVRGDPLEANPFAPGSREWFRWKEDWRITEDVASGVYADAGEVPDDYDADDREGNLKRAQAAREDQEAFDAEMDWPTFDDDGFDEEEYEKRREAEDRRIEELVAEARILNKKP